MPPLENTRSFGNLFGREKGLIADPGK